MSYEIIRFNKNKETELKIKESIQNLSILNLETLQVLSQSLLQEVESLKNKAQAEAGAAESLEGGRIDLGQKVRNYEVELIRCALLRTGGRQRQAAKLLNVKISTLHAKIKRYGISANGLEDVLG